MQSGEISVQLRIQNNPIRVPRFGRNRRFGLLFAAVCGVVYAFSYYYGSAHRAWLIAALMFLLISLAMPRVLAPFMRLWLKVGGFLHAIVSPVLLAAFYFLAVVPVGLVMQTLGKDPLRRTRRSGTYWIERNPPRTDPRAMDDLF